MLAVLDVWMHLDPLSDCTTSFFLPETRHDGATKKLLVTRGFLRSLQNGIVFWGFFDAFVYAHHKHRRDSANAGNVCQEEFGS